MVCHGPSKELDSGLDQTLISRRDWVFGCLWCLQHRGCMRKRGYKVTPPFLFKNDCSSLANMASFTSSSLTTILHSLLFLFWGHFWCANNCVFFVLSSLPLSVFSRIILITHLCRIISHLVCLNPIPLSSLARPSFVKLFVFVKEFVYLHSWLVEFIC